MSRDPVSVFDKRDIEDFKYFFRAKKCEYIIFDGLTRRQTVVYILRGVLGWDFLDIADQLNISRQAAENHYKAALKNRKRSGD